MMGRAYEVYADSRSITHEEWLQHRRSGIGGSDAGAIMGVHPYKGQFSVWADKRGYESAADDSEAMRQGRDLEEYVARRFSEKSGLTVRREYGMLRSREHPFMVANIDRRIKGEKAGLECKTSRDIYMKRYKGGDFPMEYYCQCLHYLAVTGWDAWYLAVLVYGTELLIFKICREEVQDDIDALIAAEETFWREHIERGTPLMPDGLTATSEALGTVYSRSEGYGIDSTDEESAMIDRLIALRAQKKKTEAEIRAIENRIKAIMQEAEEMRSPNALISWKNTRQRRISEKKLMELYPEIDLNAIKETTEGRRFSITTEEDGNGD